MIVRQPLGRARARVLDNRMHREWLGIPIWLLLGVIGAWMATSKGRSGCFWFLLCSFLGPIGLVIAAVIPSRR